MRGRGEARDEAECRYADGGPEARPAARAVYGLHVKSRSQLQRGGRSGATDIGVPEM